MRTKAIVLVIVLCILAAMAWAVDAQVVGRQRGGVPETKSLMSEGGRGLAVEGRSIADVVAERQ